MNIFTKYLNFINTSNGKIIVGISIIILSILTLLLSNAVISDSQANYRINNMINLIRKKDKSNYKYDIRIEKITTSTTVTDKTNGYIPLLTTKYDLSNKNNKLFNNDLNYGAIVDTYDETSLKIISAHEKDFFNDIGNKMNIGNKITIRNLKNPDEVWIYELYKVGVINKNEADVIYNSKLDSKTNIVIYSCHSEGISVNPKYRSYGYAKLIYKPKASMITSDWQKIDYNKK